MKSINLSRTEAEYLVAVLSQQHDGMAAELIELLAEVFGNTVLCAKSDEPKHE
jgi:hypothetical protein